MTSVGLWVGWVEMHGKRRVVSARRFPAILGVVLGSVFVFIRRLEFGLNPGSNGGV